MTPSIPERYQDAAFVVLDDFMPADFGARLSQLLETRRDELLHCHGSDTLDSVYWLTTALDTFAAPLAAEFRRRVLGEKLAERAADTFKIGPRNATEQYVTLFHHRCRRNWATDNFPEPSVQYALTMHTTPKMFTGGELEFLDGTVIEPKDNRLVLWRGDQQTRVRSVECWSAHVLHGRWALGGTL